jgi:hypothetical protein
VVLAEELATRESLSNVLKRFMRRRYERCKALVDISSQISQWERDQIADADVAGLTRKAVEIVAAPI